MMETRAHGSESDALVIFGISGDLAYKKIIPSIYNLVRRGRLAVPVIGVTREQWTAQRLKEPIEASVRAHGTRIDEAALAALRRCVSGVSAPLTRRPENGAMRLKKKSGYHHGED